MRHRMGKASRRVREGWYEKHARERQKTNSLVDQLMIHEEFDVMMVAIMMLCLCYIVVVVVVYSALAVVLFVLC